MDGRRTAGGKLEIKLRVRNPILNKQIEQINEKWLIIDSWLMLAADVIAAGKSGWALQVFNIALLIYFIKPYFCYYWCSIIW